MQGMRKHASEHGSCKHRKSDEGPKANDAVRHQPNMPGGQNKTKGATKTKDKATIRKLFSLSITGKNAQQKCTAIVRTSMSFQTANFHCTIKHVNRFEYNWKSSIKQEGETRNKTMSDRARKEIMQVGKKHVNWRKIGIPKLNGMPFCPALWHRRRELGRPD